MHLSFKRKVSQSSSPPFLAGTKFKIQYALQALQEPVRITMMEQTVPSGWSMGPNPSWEVDGHTLVSREPVVLNPGQKSTIITINVELAMFEQLQDPFPILMFEAETKSGEPVVVEPLAPLKAPKVAVVKASTKIRQEGETVQYGIKNMGDVNLVDILFTVQGGEVINNIAVAEEETYRIDSIKAGGTQVVDIEGKPNQPVIATVVEAFLESGMKVPTKMLPPKVRCEAEEGIYQALISTDEGLEFDSVDRSGRRRMSDPKASDLEKMVGDAIDIAKVELLDAPDTIEVGSYVRVGVTVVNGTKVPAHNVTVVGHVPKMMKVTDEEWHTYKEGEFARQIDYLVPGYEVTLPMNLRMDKSGNLNLRFVIPEED